MRLWSSQRPTRRGLNRFDVEAILRVTMRGVLGEVKESLGGGKGLVSGASLISVILCRFKVDDGDGLSTHAVRRNEMGLEGRIYVKRKENQKGMDRLRQDMVDWSA